MCSREVIPRTWQGWSSAESVAIHAGVTALKIALVRKSIIVHVLANGL